MYILTCNYLWTANKCISYVTSQATAEWCVVDYITLCIGSTAVYAGVLALLINTCLVPWALLTENTLWTTEWWTSNIVGYTRTHWSALFHLTDWVWTTRWWNAWIFWHPWCFCKSKHINKWQNQKYSKPQFYVSGDHLKWHKILETWFLWAFRHNHTKSW